MDDLKTSQSIGGHRFPNFEMLDAKIAASLKKTSNRISRKEWDEVLLLCSKACVRRAYVGLINSKPYWQCTTELPEVEDHGEELYGSENKSPNF